MACISKNRIEEFVVMVIKKNYGKGPRNVKVTVIDSKIKIIITKYLTKLENEVLTFSPELMDDLVNVRTISCKMYINSYTDELQQLFCGEIESTDILFDYILNEVQIVFRLKYS